MVAPAFPALPRPAIVAPAAAPVVAPAPVAPPPSAQVALVWAASPSKPELTAAVFTGEILRAAPAGAVSVPAAADSSSPRLGVPRTKILLGMSALGAAAGAAAACVHDARAVFPLLAAAAAPLVLAVRVVRRALRAEPDAAGLLEDPSLAPNAYAIGAGPFGGAVGVTAGLKALLLDPENLRDALSRLVADSDSGTRSFKAFRAAIAAAVPAAEGGAPADVQAAVLKADRVQMKELGERLLKAVVAREAARASSWSAAPDSAAAAVASGVGLAYLGVSRVVARVRETLGVMLGFRAPRPAADRTLSESDEAFTRTPAAPPRMLGMVTAVPEFVEASRAALSRENRTTAADAAGARAGGDARTLALALGLLSAWRTAPGAEPSREELIRLGAASRLMTVDPFDRGSGAAARVEALARQAEGPTASAKVP